MKNKGCKMTRSRKYYLEHREEKLEYVRKYRQKYPGRRKESDRKYRQTHRKERIDYKKRYRMGNREESNRLDRKYRQRCRIAARNIISDNELRCVRCGCDDFRFLEINHKNGGGRMEVKKEKNLRSALCRRIISGKRKPNDLEILCRPCNHIHFLEKKYKEKIPLRVVYDKNLKSG